MAGATILELVLQDSVTVSHGQLEVTRTLTGHPALDLALQGIRDRRKLRTTKS